MFYFRQLELSAINGWKLSTYTKDVLWSCFKRRKADVSKEFYRYFGETGTI